MNFKNLKILYIEDNLGDRVLLEDILSEFTNVESLHCCGTLSEGIEILNKEDFNIIFLDLSLPDSFGVDGVRVLNTQMNSSLPIIVFTGLNDTGIAMKALSSGAQDYIVKGEYSLPLLKRAISYAIERHRAQLELILKNQEILVSENMLRRAESMADIGSWKIDMTQGQVILSEGMSRLLALSPKINFISLNEFLSHVHFDDKQLFYNTLNSTNNLDSSEVIEARFLRSNGADFSVVCKVENVRYGNGHIVHGVIRDITSQKEVERVKEAFTIELSNKVKERTEELENIKTMLEKSLSKEKELNELKSRFVSTASHQFRTPLTVILSNVGLLEMQLSKETTILLPNLDRIIRRIKNEIDRMTETMNEVLILGKIESGGINPNFQSIDVVELCQSVVEKLNEIQLDGRKAKITVIGKKQHLHIDNNLFEDAFSNILSNSFKYSEGKASPEITFNFKQKELDILIKDFGIGIPEEDIENIFDPFYRASNTMGISGSGLGTSIIKEYIKMNNGEISIKSRINEGTTFILHFNIEK